MGKLLRAADDWLLARSNRLARLSAYLDRYFTKTGKHRPERIFG